MFAPVRNVVCLITNTLARLMRYPVAEEDGEIHLVEP